MLARIGATLDEALGRLKAHVARLYGRVRLDEAENRSRPAETGSTFAHV